MLPNNYKVIDNKNDNVTIFVVQKMLSSKKEKEKKKIRFKKTRFTIFHN